MKHAVLAALLVLAACSGDDSGSDTVSEVIDRGIAVRDAWTRPTPNTATEAAIYLEVENLDAPADELLGGRSDHCVTVQVHRTTVDDNSIAVMSAAEEGELAVTQGDVLLLEPNGLHLMCSGLSTPFDDGETAELTLVFAHHQPITVPLAVEHR